MKSLKCLLFMLLLIVAGTLRAQDIVSGSEIDGVVKDANQKPVDYATVSLIRVADSAAVKSVMTDGKGRYSFKNIPASAYRVAVHQVGQSKHLSEVVTLNTSNPVLHMKPATLSPDSKQLKEVNIAVQKPAIERRGDKLIVNVENSSVSAGSTALEVLQRAPGVSLDKDDNVALKGKQGVLIMIDGKPTYLSNTDLAAMLRNMQSNEIESIEIINNPSARYEAEGKSGIINIKLKKNKNYGTNGTFTLGAGYSSKRKSNTGITLNNRNEKLNIFGNYNYNNSQGEQHMQIDRVNAGQTTSAIFNQTGNADRAWYNNNFKVGADVFLNKNNTIGVLATGYINQWREMYSNGTLIRSMQGVLDSSLLSQNDSRSNYNNLSYNLNYKSVLDTAGRELTVDLDYANNDSKSRMLYDNVYAYASGTQKVNELLENKTPSGINIYAVKTDYTHPFSKSFKMETGFKLSWVKTDNDFQARRMGSQQWEDDPRRSNHFIYDESVKAGYVNFRKEFKKVNVQVGLRAEQTGSKGNLVTTGQVVERDYLDFFPSAAVNYTVNENNSMGITYSRRITRPAYDDLNPFEYFLDRYTYNQGNPFLNPEYTNTFELSYTLLKKYNASVSYTKTTDVMTQVLLPAPEKSALYQTNANLAEQLSYSFNLSAPFTYTKWWNSNTNLTVFNNHFKSPNLNGQVLDNSQTAFQVFHSENVTLNSSTSFELSGNYQSKLIYGTFLVQPQYAIDFGFSKSFMAKKVNLKLAVNDVFKTRRGKISSAYPGLDYSVNQRFDSRTARLTLSYKFGNNNLKESRKRSTGLDSEAGRIKN
ncbi:MAG: TonB-dependent receptor domain-containing protein [Arcticibacter sp.]